MENQLSALKKYEFFKPLIHTVNSIIDNSYTDCYDKYVQTFFYTCIYDIEFRSIGSTEVYNLKVSDKIMGLYDLKKIKLLNKEVSFLIK